MKYWFFPLILFVTPLFAEDLPVVWLEAGKKDSVPVVDRFLRTQDWTLRFEHRILAQGKATEMISSVLPAGYHKVEINIPPLKPGNTLKAKLFFGDKPHYDIVIASPDPFEDRKAWFAEHPIALYDPEQSIVYVFEKEEIPFKRLRSFADITSCENAVIVVGQGVDFEKEKKLTDLLFKKAAQGGFILVAAPKGDIFPFGYSSPITDIRFSDKYDKKPTGRIVFDKNLRFFDGIESRWYFKSLIETLTPTKGGLL